MMFFADPVTYVYATLTHITHAYGRKIDVNVETGSGQSIYPGQVGHFFPDHVGHLDQIIGNWVIIWSSLSCS